MREAMETVVYKSKVDGWLFLILAGAVVIPAYGGIQVVLTVPGTSPGPLILTIVLVIALPLWLLFGTSYTLQADKLLIRCGPLKWEILLAEIKAITPVRSFLSSPALSMDRLRIDYGRGMSIMISPQNKKQFLKDIEERRRGLL